MKKILEVDIKDFRVFNGSHKFDFRNQQGEVADFICIYGENGMGKTSFFEGMEWFSCGEIYKFKDKDIKKELSKYKGYILKNRDSESESASIKVKFSDMSSATRTIKKRANSKNDYLKGTIIPIHMDGVLRSKQILPHSKIDSFVYATKPSDKYEEWGSFWDEDGKQREIFNKIYQIKKMYEKKVEDLEKYIQSDKKRLQNLSIDSNTIDEINKKINIYNNNILGNERKINSIEILEDGLLDMPSEELIIENINTSKIYNEEKKDLLWKIKYLIMNYNEYLELLKNMEDERILEYEEILKNTSMLHNKGKLWYEHYLTELKLKDSIKNKNIAIEMYNQEIDKFYKDEKKIKTNIVDEQLKLTEFKKNKLSFLEMNEFIINSEKILNDLDLKLKIKNKHIKKLNEIGEIYNSKNEFFKSNIISKNDTNKDIIEHFSKIIDFDNELTEEKKHFIKTLENIINDLKNIEKNIDSNRIIYNSLKSNYNHLSKLIIEITSLIKENELSECPICKTNFKNTKNLLDKIDLSNEEDILNKKIIEINKLDIEKNKIYSELDFQINKWNLSCKEKEILNIKKKKKLNKIIEKSKKKFKNIYQNKETLIELKKKYTEELRKNNLISNEHNDFINNIEVIEKNHNNRIKDLNIEIENVNKKILDTKKENDKLNKEVESIKNKYTLFFNNEINIKLVEELNYVKKYLSKVDIINMNNINWKMIDSFYYRIKDRHLKSKEKKKDITSKQNEIKYIEKDVNEFDFIKYENYKNVIYSNSDIYYEKILTDKEKLDTTIKKYNENIKMLDEIYNRIYLTKYNENYKKIKEIIRKNAKDIELYNTYKNKIDCIFKIMKNELELSLKNEFGSDSMNQIYKLIEPHKDFKDLKYEVIFNEQDVPGLYIKGEDNKEKKDINPEYFFSSAQLNTVALSVFFGGALSAQDSKIKSILIDDPVGHFDDINVLAFVDLLRNIISEGKWQIIISTHDYTFFNLLKAKLDTKYYNSKYIEFSTAGRLLK